VLNRLGFIPRGGESFEADGFRFTVMEMDHRRVSRVKMKKLRPVAVEAASDVAPGSKEEASSSRTAAEKLGTTKAAGGLDATKLRPAKAPR
jgi:Transporter associated domain